jgi:hypothetical protein
MSTSIQKYSGYTQEEAAEVASATQSGSKFFKLKPKKNVVRFCPAPSGRKPVVVTHNHFVELVPGVPETKVNFNCPLKMARRRCPLCERAQELVNTGDKRDRDRAFELFPKVRVYANIVDRAAEDAGTQVFAFGKKILEQLNAIREDCGDFCELGPDGYDVIIRREGSGIRDTTYTVNRAGHASEFMEDAVEGDKTLGGMADLTQFARVPTDAELKNIISTAKDAGGVGSRRQADEDDAPKARAGKSKQTYIDTTAESDEDEPAEEWK